MIRSQFTSRLDLFFYNLLLWDGSFRVLNMHIMFFYYILFITFDPTAIVSVADILSNLCSQVHFGWFWPPNQFLCLLSDSWTLQTSCLFSPEVFFSVHWSCGLVNEFTSQASPWVKSLFYSIYRFSFAFGTC